MRPKPPAVGAPPVRSGTREQLLEVAGEVFAAVGFHKATVREISQRAGANIAAVNYHFGDKESLYAAVLKESFRLAMRKYPPDLGLTPIATPAVRLKAFVRSFLLRIFSGGPEARHGRLMLREMIEPTRALDELVHTELRQLADALMAIMRELLGRAAAQDLVRRCGMSVVSQVVFYHHCRPAIRRLFPDLTFDREQIEKLAEHITEFSLAAIAEVARKNSVAGPGPTKVRNTVPPSATAGKAGGSKK